MRFAAVKRWKTKERKFNQKYKLKIAKKNSNSRDLSGKFVFLLSKTNICAVVKFLTKNVCVTQTLIFVDGNFPNQISSKYVIPHKKHKKLLAQSEVRITESFRLRCQKHFSKYNSSCDKVNDTPTQKTNKNLNNDSEENEKPKAVQHEIRKISPIKILFCKICDQKFLRKDLLDAHVCKEKESDEDSDDSLDKLFIDDDIELVQPNIETINSSFNKNVPIKRELPIPLRTVRKYKCLQCSALCATEDSLLAHIERTHPCSSTSTSPRQFYDFNRPERKRSLSSNSSFTTTSKQSSIDSPDSEQKIKYQKYDSINKTEFNCKICSASYDDRKHLNRHIITIHLSKVYKCFKCNVPFNHRPHLFRHLQTAHIKYKDEEGYIATLKDQETVAYFQCCFCKYSSKLKFKVEEHLINEHYEDFEKNDFQEDSISSSPDSLEELLLPETRALRNKDEMDEDNLLTELIPKESYSNSKKRKPANDPSFPYRCGRCLKRFSRSSWLRKHPCPGSGTIIKTESNPEPKKQRLSYHVNGFLRCPMDKSCSHVFTDRRLYDEHVKNTH